MIEGPRRSVGAPSCNDLGLAAKSIETAAIASSTPMTAKASLKAMIRACRLTARRSDDGLVRSRPPGRTRHAP